jgi:hypothetical protein
MFDDGEVLRGVVFADAPVIFSKDDIKDPVQGVFDAPVAAHGLCKDRQVACKRADI